MCSGHDLCRLAPVVAVVLAAIGVPQVSAAPVRVVDFICEGPMTRALRPLGLFATIESLSDEPADAVVRLVVPTGVRVLEPTGPTEVRLGPREERDLRWRITADSELRDNVRMEVRVGGAVAAEASLPIRFVPALEAQPQGYIPPPQPARTQLLIGAHHCPLWEADKPAMWAQIRKHPERTPALGFYAGENPEVADWETTWAVEHGVSFFVYCWYRTSQGGPVQTQFESAITKALFHSRYADKMRFTIMWENQSRGHAGVSDERDLMENLLPYWIETLFRNPSYLKVDNKPVLFIYRPEFLVDDLGGVPNVVHAFDLMREACRKAGFDGLYILGEYRGLEASHLELMKSLGLDYTFAYCWYVGNNPTSQQAIDAQMGYIRGTQELGILPQVVTVSQGWSGWSDEGSIWTIPPRDYEGLLRQAKDFVAGLPPGQLGSRMLLLDNWNEWGEGHYISPHTDAGFGYLDAVRRVFSDAPAEHVDLIPSDLGLGPYDPTYRAYMASERALRRATAIYKRKPGADDPGLVAWWAFDDDPGSEVAADYSGHRIGAKIAGAQIVPGRDGSCLRCDGGCAVATSRDALNTGAALTVECWVKTDTVGQNNRWIVNRVYQSGDTGYRLGVLHGRPCFEVPQTSWSHHLEADVNLSTGRWVHLAGTFDGTTMRIYVDGALHGSMERPGPVKPNAYPLTLGSYEQGHPSFYQGLLDEVRLYGRALSAQEVAAHASAGGR